MILSIRASATPNALTTPIYNITRGRTAKRNDIVNTRERNAKRIDGTNIYIITRRRTGKRNDTVNTRERIAKRIDYPNI